MNCGECEELLHGYLDGELDAAGTMTVERHLAACAHCSALYSGLLSLSSAVRNHADRYSAPDSLRRRIRSAVRDQRRSFWNVSWRVPAFAAGVAVLVGFLILLGRVLPGGQHEEIQRAVLDSHLRSLQMAHTIDVASSDQHTVKPWFNGKIDYSPIVKDLDAEGFLLAGGRLDYVRGKPVAVVVYKRHLHVVNLYEWKSGDNPFAQNAVTLQGITMIGWKAGDLTFWAVSDVNQSDLLAFERHMQE